MCVCRGGRLRRSTSTTPPDSVAAPAGRRTQGRSPRSRTTRTCSCPATTDCAVPGGASGPPPPPGPERRSRIRRSTSTCGGRIGTAERCSVYPDPPPPDHRARSWTTTVAWSGNCAGLRRRVGSSRTRRSSDLRGGGGASASA